MRQNIPNEIPNYRNSMQQKYIYPGKQTKRSTLFSLFFVYHKDFINIQLRSHEVPTELPSTGIKLDRDSFYFYHDRHSVLSWEPSQVDFKKKISACQ